MNSVLGRHIEAERQALERDARNLRGGVLRQDPSLMQRIGSTIADYAVPDHWEDLFKQGSVFDRFTPIFPSEEYPNQFQEPYIKFGSGGDTPYSQEVADAGMQFLMDTMPQAGVGGVIKRATGRVGGAVKNIIAIELDACIHTRVHGWVPFSPRRWVDALTRHRQVIRAKALSSRSTAGS